MLPKRFLFRFSTPCLYRQKLWAARGAGLGENHRLIGFAELEEGVRPVVEVRAAWSELGMVFEFRVTGKEQAPWCRTTRPEDSDGIQVWIDTRNVHNVHRAGRFCHRFLFMPTGEGKNSDLPIVQWMPINRAREHPKAIEPGEIKARSEMLDDGYLLEIYLPAAALTGFDPEEYPAVGFNYAVIDRELGEQTFAAGSPMPYKEDPSLWATLELVK